MWGDLIVLVAVAVFAYCVGRTDERGSQGWKVVDALRKALAAEEKYEREKDQHAYWFDVAVDRADELDALRAELADVREGMDYYEDSADKRQLVINRYYKQLQETRRAYAQMFAQALRNADIAEQRLAACNSLNAELIEVKCGQDAVRRAARAAEQARFEAIRELAIQKGNEVNRLRTTLDAKADELERTQAARDEARRRADNNLRYMLELNRELRELREAHAQRGGIGRLLNGIRKGNK